MRKFIVNPATNQYESTEYKPTHSNLMKSIGRPDVAKALDKNKKRLTGSNNKNVGALDVASAQGRDILSEQLMYKWDSSSGKFFNGQGKSVDTIAEANKSNDEVALFAPGNEGKEFEAQFKRDKQTALKGFYPRVHDKEFENTLRKVQGKKKKLSDIDLQFSAADPKEKAGMRRRYSDYNFDQRKFKEDIKKSEPVEINHNMSAHLYNMQRLEQIKSSAVEDEKKFRELTAVKPDEDLSRGLGSLLGVLDDKNS